MKKWFCVLIGLFVSLITSSQTASYEVYALKYASLLQPSPTTADKDIENVDFMIWLIKGNNGKNILTDAGFLYGIKQGDNFNAINFLQSDSTLQKLSVRPEDITDIILSKALRWDHIDLKAMFPNAHMWIQKDEYNYFTRTAWQKGGVNAAFNKKNVRNLIELNETGRLTMVEGTNKEVIPGVKLYAGSPQSSVPQYVMVKTTFHNTVLSSDNIWLYYNLEQYTPTPFYGAFDANGYIKGMQKMKTLLANSESKMPANDSIPASKFAVAAEGVIKIK